MGALNLQGALTEMIKVACQDKDGLTFTCRTCGSHYLNIANDEHMQSIDGNATPFEIENKFMCADCNEPIMFTITIDDDLQ